MPDDDLKALLRLFGGGGNLLVFLVSDGRQPFWSIGVDDRQAIDMLVAEGCHTVAESDGGGSASMWIRNLPKKLTPRDKDYINRPSDGHPRRRRCGWKTLFSPTSEVTPST